MHLESKLERATLLANVRAEDERRAASASAETGSKRSTQWRPVGKNYQHKSGLTYTVALNYTLLVKSYLLRWTRSQQQILYVCDAAVLDRLEAIGTTLV